MRLLELRPLKATRNEIDKYSGLVQSHASSPTITTRALVSTLRTRKLHCEMQQNWPSSTIERKLYLAASHWARMKKEEIVRLKEEGNKRRLRNQQKYVQKCQRSQRVKDVRRQLCQVIFTENSESSKKWNRSSVQGLAPSHDSLPTTTGSSISTLHTRKSHAQIKRRRRKKKKGSTLSIERRFYLAESRWVKMKESVRLKQGRGGKNKWQLFIYIWMTCCGW